MLLNDLYKLLFTHYGSQNWWPGKGFEIAIGAVLTQNTSWSNVEKALENLRRNDLLEPLAIAQCDLDFLKEQIKPSGFFNQKGQYLKNLSLLWLENQTPSREELLAVKGIGEETADSILLYLLKEPEFVIDAYTKRICERLGFGSFSSYSLWKNFFEENLMKDEQFFNEFHALFVIHAKTFCKKTNPLCSDCFLHKKCLFNKSKH